MEDNQFGNIKWDKDKPWRGIITLATGKTAKVELDVYETKKEAALNTLKFLIENETQIRHKIALLLFRDCTEWIEDHVTTPEQLALRIDLSDIMIGEGGDGQLSYYANGDDYMFTDHAVRVWFDANGEIADEVELSG